MKRSRSKKPLGPAGEPTYVALAKSLAREIRTGGLRPGARLPGSRTLAAELGVSRNTVLAAYDDLAAQGWVETHPARGTFVREALRDAPVGRRAARHDTGRERVGFDLPAGPELAGVPAPWSPTPAGTTDLSTGVPDGRLFPVDLLARAYRRVLRQRGPALLAYGDPRGEASLRRELARHLAETRGLEVPPERVLVTRGSQMALALAIGAVVRPGDRVAVERFGYRPVWEVLRRAGAELVPVSVDEHGTCVEELPALEPLRAVYVTPHHQFPTMALLSADRRATLLDWAGRRRVAVLEDDYDHEYHYRGLPAAPLASVDRSGVVAYVGSLSKVLAPGLRVGYLVGPADLVERATRLRRSLDRQGDRVVEAAIADLLALGELQRHARKLRRTNLERRTALARALERDLGNALEVDLPAGGMSVWARIVDGTDPAAWAAESERRGVRVGTASEYDFHAEEGPYLRLAFAAFTPVELERAVGVLRQAHSALARRSRKA